MSIRYIFPVVFLVSACAKLEVPENTAIADNDGDGYAVSDGDCDDNDPVKNPSDADGDGQSSCEGDCDDNSRSTYSGSAEKDSADACMKDDDGDGYGDSSPPPLVTPGTDCDDLDVTRGSNLVDGDCDGVLTVEDCDDSDEDMPNNDSDCDGVSTSDDCDDSDATMPNDDSDCDGTLMADDCDDEDSASTVASEDADCDGVVDSLDCAVSDPSKPAEDGDCDGVLTAADCDDFDASSTIVAEDSDCDDVLATEDCDDGDVSVGSVSLDGDCDGVYTALDCDDAEESMGAIETDGDCDGVLTMDDCDDEDASKPAEDGDCDGVLTSADCDDTEAYLGAIETDGDCDGVLAMDDCDDEDASKPVDDGDCDGIVTALDCDDGDPESTDVDVDADCDGALTADDCDDSDWTVLGRTYDPDCDGVAGVTGCHGGGMITIEAQTFEMGSTPGASCDGGSCGLAHTVTLSRDFYIGQTEVTQGEYYTIMGVSPSYFSECGSDCPVEQITWHMAAAYTNAVSDSEGLERCYECSGSGESTVCSEAMATPYECDGYRLPTEAEWEGAARCGSDLMYAGSSSPSEVALYTPDVECPDWVIELGGSCEGTGPSAPQSVALLAGNACGLYDMSGNVYEWVGDWMDYSYYSVSPSIDPVGPDEGDMRGLRGGAWWGAEYGIKVANRYRNEPADRSTFYTNGDTGFRLARTAPFSYTTPECSGVFEDAGSLVGDSCGAGMVYDCALSCVSSAIADSYISDGYCDDGTWDYDLTCDEFDFDGGDCGW